jgi:asparagine synthase (glutamine-hydrolysing)
MLALDMQLTLADSDLPKVRGACAMAGVEVAFPLLDDDLLAFAAHLPARMKVRGAHLRWFFKQALREFLPREVVAKPKHGFGLPFGVWLAREPLLQELARDSLDALARRGIVRRQFVRDLFERHLPEHPAYHGTMVWVLMMLEQWFRQRAGN